MTTSPTPSHEPASDERLRSEFNEWARAGKGESMERGHRPVGEQAIARMQIPSHAHVLDVGCGSGWAARTIARLGITKARRKRVRSNFTSTAILCASATSGFARSVNTMPGQNNRA